jgi:putative transposase
VHFTNEGFTGMLKREQVTVSMDGQGRAIDNIYLQCSCSSPRASRPLWRSRSDKHSHAYSFAEVFAEDNGDRPNQAL